MKNKSDMNELFKNAGILFAITLLAGIMLGFVYELTKEPIAYQKELKVQRACAAVFAEAASFEEVPGLDAEPASSVSVDAAAQEVLGYSAENGTELGKLYHALSADGAVLGYVINVTSKEGYGGNIEIMMGVKTDGTLNGISLVAISETKGLGMQAEEVLVPQFTDRQVSSFTYTKSGAGKEDEIDAISGATITTKAVTNAVDTGLYYFEKVLQEGGNK